jgi:hypothetical protein
MIGRRSPDEAQRFADALDGRTAKDDHVADLVRFAESLCEAAVAEPTPAFRDSLRAQLMADAATVLVATPPTPRRPVAVEPAPSAARRRLAGATAALVASAGVVGLVASSASAVPGEMLYPVKRSVESAELALHRGDASRGSFQLAQASERLAEARALSADGRSPDLIAQTLDDFATSAVTGSSQLFDDFSTTGAKKSVQEVNSFAAASSTDLSRLSSELPDDIAGIGDSLAAASAAVTEVAGQAANLCASCDPADIGALSSIAPLAKNVPTPAVRGDRPVAAKPAPQATQPGTTAPAAPLTSRATTPAPTPTGAPPATTFTPTSPLAPVTDPLLGGLLGDDDQVGLLPGLVNGLLGVPPKQ